MTALERHLIAVGIGLVVGIGGVTLWTAAKAQQPAKKPTCWLAYVTPDSHTTQCSNGYWVTQMQDGTQVHGNGIIDPNAGARGSTVGIDAKTGGPSLKGDAMIQGPGNQPLEAPHQGQLWGQQPLQNR